MAGDNMTDRHIPQCLNAYHEQTPYYEVIDFIDRITHALCSSSNQPITQNTHTADKITLTNPIVNSFARHTPYTVFENNSGHITITTTHAGLLTHQSPLPDHYYDLLCEQAKFKDERFASFISLFNSYFLSLEYRVFRYTHPFYQYKTYLDNRDNYNPYKAIVQCGMSTKSKSTNSTDITPIINAFSYAFRSKHRTASDLTHILTTYFQQDIHIQSNAGKWQVKSESLFTYLGGDTTRNATLGRSTTLGTQFYDVSYHLIITIGPLSRKDYDGWLLQPTKLQELQAIIAHYLPRYFYYSVKLQHSKHDTTGMRLSTQSYSMLGRHAWLGKPAANALTHTLLSGISNDR